MKNLLSFKHNKKETRGSLKVYDILCKKDNDGVVGKVKWSIREKRYYLLTEKKVRLDSLQLGEIRNFLEYLNIERKFIWNR